jgi:hypothetical protein
MENNVYQGSQSYGSPPYDPSLLNGGSRGTMPPVAPSYKHSPWTAERNVYPVNDSEQLALDRLMDSVHQGRIEDVHIGQGSLQICIEDAHIVQGAIEIRARIVPKPGVHLENKDYPGLVIPPPGYKQPVYSYPYSNQLRNEHAYSYQAPTQYPPASPYPYLNQIPSQPQYPYTYQYPNQTLSQSQYCYPYQYPNQILPQPQYAYQYPYQYMNQIPSQYPYLYRQYPNQFPVRYPYPLASAAGGIAGAISQLVLTANLLRR